MRNDPFLEIEGPEFSESETNEDDEIQGGLN